MDERDYTRQLASYVVETKYKDLPDEVINKAKLCILDWYGASLAGRNEKEVRITYDFINEIGGKEQCTIVGFNKKSSCVNAALINGMMAHVFEFDDVHEASIYHPGAPIISAALAVAEKEKMSGKDLLLAIVLGYEVSIRIGESVGSSHYRYWHTTGTCGTFGAAVAAGKLLSLSEEQMLFCLGNAGTQASGLWEFGRDGAMSKVLHVGKAAVNGIIAALLARKSFTGAKKILEGDRGFCRATSDDFNLLKLVARLGAEYKILGVSFKAYPSCRHTHSSIDACLNIISNNINYRNIDTIQVRTYSQAIATAGNKHPKTEREAKFSIPFCIAVALKYGKVSVTEFNKKVLKDQEITELISKVRLIGDKTIEERYPLEWRAIVEVQTYSGHTYTEEVAFPIGHPHNPLHEKDIILKYKEIIDSDLRDRLVNFNTELIDLENSSDITSLMIGL